MYLVPFYSLFPEQAFAETRTITTTGHPLLPDDDYGLIELYCTDPTCNCRRVMLNVISQRQKAHVATINFGFDRRKRDAGPFLDPLNPQSKYSAALLHLVATQVLNDRAYVARLEAHYRKSKGAKPQADAEQSWEPSDDKLVSQPARLSTNQPVARGRPRPSKR